MAYKFQIGAAILSGSIKAEDGLVSTDVDDATAANIVAQIDDKEIAHTKVALENGDILIGDGSGIAQNQTISGDATLAAGGALTIADNAISLAKMAGLTRGSIIHGDSSGDPAALAKGNANTVLSSDGTDVSYTSVSAAMIADNAISLAKMAGLTRGSIIHGDSSGDPAALAKGSANTVLSSDGTDVSYTSVSNAMLANSAVTITAGDGLKTGGSVALGAAVTLDVDVSDFAGTGIDADGSENLNIAAAQTSITSIINASMGKIGTDAAQEYIDFGSANEIKFAVNNAVVASAEAGVFVVAGDLRVNGTTTSVNSTTINISSSFTFEGPADDHETVLSAGSPGADSTLTLPTLSAGSYFIPALADAATDASAAVTAAEFALLDGGNSRGTDSLADGDGFLHNDNGTMKQTNVLKMFEYTVAKVSGDVAIADTGVASIQANAVEGSMLNNNIVSGLTDIGAAIVDTDEMIVSDNGTIRRTDMSRLKTFIGNGTSATAGFGDEDATLIVGVNYATANSSAARTLTLPASPSVGESVKVKVAGVSGGLITIARAGSQTIDGSLTAIVLESDSAAVELVYVASDDWRVF